MTPAAGLSAANLAEIAVRARRLTFIFTVRREGKAWLVQDSHGAMLALSPFKDAAVQSARRAAILMSETGVRVIVMLENCDGDFATIFIADPLPRQAHPALVS